LDKKVSPPFEGGVIGTIDYHTYTVLSFPTGVVDLMISFYLLPFTFYLLPFTLFLTPDA
jgi:hypothetical protein